MIVLDASAAVELVLATDAGLRVADRIADPDVSLHAPHLLGVEVAQVLRRLVAAESLGDDQATAVLDDLADLDVVRYPHEPLLGRAFALRQNVTAYDGVYVALAEALEAPLVTFDARLAAAPGHRAEVELLDAAPGPP